MIAQFENALLHGEYKKIVGSLMIDSTKPIDEATPYQDLSGLKLFEEIFKSA